MGRDRKGLERNGKERFLKLKERLTEADIGDILWAFEISGISTSKLQKLARDIPGAFNLSRGPRGWRFRKAEFLKWMEERLTTND